MKKLRLVFLAIGIISCEKVSNDTLDTNSLTVEAQIKEGRVAEVYLTNAISFESTIDSLSILEAIESKAKVVLSSGEDSEVLTLKRNDNRFPFAYYEGNEIKGEVGKEYALTVSIRGEVFTSTSSIPEKPRILDVDFMDAVNENDPNEKVVDLKLTVENNREIKYFKILAKNVNENKFSNAKPLIFSSETLSATESFPVFISYSKEIDGKFVNQVKPGESYEISLIAISKEQFDFWKSIKGDQTSIQDNASLSINTPSNISNGAFGYWSGENVTTIRVDVPLAIKFL